MIQLQIISKVLASKDYSIIQDNLLTEDYFLEYLNEFKYIDEHYKKYGNVPDEATFLSVFPDVELVEVTESDKYLVDTIKEDYLYSKTVPVIQEAANLLKSNSNVAAEYLLKSIKELQPNSEVDGVDIISQSRKRLKTLKDKRDNNGGWFYTTGFAELDEIIHGIERKEELIVVFARINQGKSWVLEYICTHIWENGGNIGYISPEMSAESVGYRFDTLHKNISNKNLMWCSKNVDIEEYSNYIDDLSTKENKFIVSTPINFNRKITVSKLRSWIIKNKIDVLAIDGISYMTDERERRGDTKSIALTNISEDLMELSIELEIPVVVVVQANRGGVKEEDDGTPELENIKDSDGIAANASKVLSLKQSKDGVLTIDVKKNRFGLVNKKVQYMWEIDTGNFTYMAGATKTEEAPRRKEKTTKEDVF